MKVFGWRTSKISNKTSNNSPSAEFDPTQLFDEPTPTLCEFDKLLDKGLASVLPMAGGRNVRPSEGLGNSKQVWYGSDGRLYSKNLK